MKRVLITDAQQRKALAATRSLGKKGIRVTAAEETRFNPTFFSKYCKDSLVYPSPIDKPAEFYDWLLQTLREEKFDLLLPMDDATLDIVAENRAELEQYTIIPLPSTESYRLAADKGLAVSAAREAGLDCPKTRMITSLEELETVCQELEFPVVIKPRKSSGSRGIRVVECKGDFRETYLAVHKTYPLPLVQEYMEPGERYDVCLLLGKDSKLKAGFVQKELRHFPTKMGPSTVQESVFFPELLKQAQDLMTRLDWWGIAEVEFMYDKKEGKYKFMEINPRFWNSLQLSILSGVDFPWLLYLLAVEGDCEEVLRYETGVRCRWLLPGDILHFLTNKERFALDPPFFSGKKQGLYNDIVSYEDLLPVWGFALACLRYLFDRSMWRRFFAR